MLSNARRGKSLEGVVDGISESGGVVPQIVGHDLVELGAQGSGPTCRVKIVHAGTTLCASTCHRWGTLDDGSVAAAAAFSSNRTSWTSAHTGAG